MKYTGQFKDINENLYTVNIITDNDSSTTKTVTLGTTPFVTEVETSEEHLYKPVKYSMATVRMINDDYSFDLYSAEAQENKVTLTDKDNVIRWIGYTTPNLYSQGYENEVEEIEIECIDALATLQYYKYERIGDITNRIVCVIDVINSIISKCNAYTTYYISNATQYSSIATECLPSRLYISEQNFFDEDDEPMTMQEVLEEICQYLNVTCIADGTSVYFLDYDAIKNNINTYYQFTVGNTTGTLVTLSQSHSIDGGDYVENGGQISLDNVYNKVTVKDSLYSFENAIPDIFDEKVLVNYGGNYLHTENLEIEDNDGKGGKHKCFFRYYKNPNYKSTYYEYSYYTLTPIVAPTTINYEFIQNYIGATILKGFFKKVDDFSDNAYNLNFTDYLLLHSHDSNQTIGDSWYLPNMTVDNELGLPIFESVKTYDSAFIGGNNVYIIIKGTYIQMDREKMMYIPEGYSQKDDDFDKKYLWLKAKLEFNGQYWNGSSWQNAETCFKLEFDTESEKHHCNKPFSIKNNITWDMGLDEEGYAIKLPNSIITTSKPKLTLYTPHRMDMGYRCDAVWLKNFSVGLRITKKDLFADENSDTEYTNVINNNYVNEMDDIEFKLCTWDNKQPNYSAIAYKSNTTYSFLDTTYNKATKQTLRQEEHLIYRLVTQYSTPSAILNLNLKNTIKPYCVLNDKWLPNKLFIVDSITTDWEYNKAEIKLIEKK